MSEDFDLIQAAEELLSRDDELLDQYVPNPRSLGSEIPDFHEQAGKVIERWVLGGNRSGKTLAGAVEAAWFATGRHPHFKVPVPNKGWVVSLDFNESRTITEPLILSLIPERMISRCVKANNNIIQIQLKNGSQIDFKACEQGWQKFQSAGLDWVWFDEEPLEERIYSETKMRARAGRRLHIWGTMTPLRGFSWHYHRIYLLRDEQLRFYRAPMDSNPHLLPEERARMKAQILSREYQSRVFGDYASFEGVPFFGMEKIEKLQEECYEGIKGRMVNKGFMQDPDGPLEIWQPPQKDAVYVIGGDVASERGPNKSVASVFNRETWEKVGMWLGNTHPKNFGNAMVDMGRWYNDALLVPECNNHGISTIDALKEAAYPNVFHMGIVGEMQEQETERLGWHENSKTRPLLLNALASAVQEGLLKIYCTRTLDQYRTFVLDSEGRPAAGQGCDDDIIFADGMALQGCKTLFSHKEYLDERRKRKPARYDSRTGVLIGRRYPD